MAAVPTWQPGTLYQPGDIVQPITAPPATAAQVENGDFTAGNANWDFTGGAEFSTTGGYTNNGNCVRMPGSVAEGLALNRTQLVVPSTGSTFEATAMIQQGASIAGATRGWVEVRWYDVGGVLITSERGNVVSDGSGGAWHQSKVTATRPAGAAYARAGIALFSVADHSHPIWGDNLVVSGTFAGLPEGLVYKAVQPESGFSDADEPTWPPILGQQVIDNEVIWEAVASTRVTWEASPIYVSGPVEPVWPTEIGGFVRDGTIDWKTVSRRVEDANCPDSKIVVIAASKVFAGDDDIVRYSATVNPLDWTTADDAGYLPTGLQNYGANPVAAMGLYRGNLVVFNAEGFQLWQVDEDPASMSLIDALPLGCTEHGSIAPVSNDLFFAASKGVRSIGIAASSTNYQAGDVGMPIDPLVEPQIRVSSQGFSRSLGLFHPAMGQYWLAFPGFVRPELTLLGNVPDGLLGMKGSGQYNISGGFTPYGPVEVTSGALPPGLVLLEDGTYTFEYSQVGSFAWTASVEDRKSDVAMRPDTAVVTDPDTWFGRASGGSAPLIKGKYKAGAWQTLPAITSPSFQPGYMYATPGMLHASAQASPAYRYSIDGGVSWVAPANNGGVSAGGARMAFKGSYAFQCGGVNELKRRVLPSGDWTIPSASSLSRANSIVVVGDTLIVASIYNQGTSASANDGVSWVVGAAYQNGILGSPLLATNGSRIVIFYGTPVAGGYLMHLKYSDDKGATWSAPVYTFPNPGASNNPAEFIFDGLYFIAVSTTGQVVRSLDGIVWQLMAATLPTVQQMAAGDRMIMAAGLTNGLKFSEDHGATWTLRALPAGSDSANCITWIPQG